ncbi:MAG: hypothetical protein ACR2RE_27750, partial [Geminicoccaceae bacterium]
LALIAIFLVVRPAMAKLMPEPVMLDSHAKDGGAEGAGPGGGLPAIVDEKGQVISQGALVTGDGSSTESGAGQQGGREGTGIPEFDDPVRVALIEQAREVIESRPDDAAALMKQWLDQETGSRHG